MNSSEFGNSKLYRVAADNLRDMVTMEIHPNACMGPLWQNLKAKASFRPTQNCNPVSV